MSNFDEEVIEETLDTQEEADLDTAGESEDTTDWKAEAQKQKERADNMKIRAEKAEGKTKETKSEPKKEPVQQGYTLQDQMALMKADVAIEDIDVVADYAKYKGISIAEALKSSVVKAELAEKAELRNSANAANTGNSRRPSTKISDDMLLANARKGQMPDSDEDIMRLNDLRRSRK